jgi:hypothetical protein
MMNSWHVVGDVFRPKSGFTSFDWSPSRSQALSVNRAMHSFVRKFPQFALMGGQGRKRLILYDTTDPESIAWATVSMNNKEPIARYDPSVQTLLKTMLHRKPVHGEVLV